MTLRLSADNLYSAKNVLLPRYSRALVTPRILHIGVGNFHRAHQAVYSDDLLNLGLMDWGIVGASLKSTTAFDQLTPQNALYTVSTKTPDQVERRAIGAIHSILDTALSLDALIATIADPVIQVLTLTVTEKGYCGTDQALNTNHPDIMHDANISNQPRSLIGVLCAGLEKRRKARAGAITLLSCDNLANNGRVLARVVTDFAQLTNPALARWIPEHVGFPNSMVDRIVPHSTAADCKQFTQECGLRDEAMVVCEPFKQWVVEDHFRAAKPPWDEAGVIWVNDTGLYESAKLRLLNGSHSAAAYLGLIAGYEFIHEVMADRKLNRFLQKLVALEVQSTVTQPAGFDLNRYVDSIFSRFANSAIAYPTLKVASDGSQKLPQRLLPVIKLRLAQGLSVEHLMLVIACWVETLPKGVPDPEQTQLQHLYDNAKSISDLVTALCEHTVIFDSLDATISEFQLPLTASVRLLREQGLTRTLGKLY